LSTCVWMRSMPPSNKTLAYSPLISLVAKQSWIRRKSYSPHGLQPFEVFFLPLTQGELSRFCFPDCFMFVFASHFPSHGPQMRHRLFVNILGNLSIPGSIPAWKTHRRSEVLTCHNTLGINFLVTQNTKFAITLLESQKSGLSIGRFLQFCKSPPRKGYQ